MKVALFRHVAIASRQLAGAPGTEHLEHLPEFKRVSEYVDVHFPPLAPVTPAAAPVSPSAPGEAGDGCDDDYDGAPYCNAGHKTQAGCDCPAYADSH